MMTHVKCDDYFAIVLRIRGLVKSRADCNATSARRRTTAHTPLHCMPSFIYIVAMYCSKEIVILAVCIFIAFWCIAIIRCPKYLICK
jgi:hypothetical protein